MLKLGRNDVCHCGSGRKYKKCCIELDREEERRLAAAQASGGLQSYADIERLLDQELVWEAPSYGELARELAKQMKEGYTPAQISLALFMWKEYTDANKPSFRKSGVYCAALEYLICEIQSIPSSKAELAEKYSVSVSTLSKKCTELTSFFMEQYAELQAEQPEAAATDDAENAEQLQQEELVKA
ncbi:SEC-C metal-binding domain-containing protein [Paenibacillus sp. FSL H8-0537]|uniref:SEC-C metal-binding domain-containing protein n=1 Tax=Paenibacillus sp. FSL H8-0537 TaxID=2921399 RepID=UPI003100E49E